MNDWQQIRQLRYLIEKAVWPGANGKPVVSRCLMTAGWDAGDEAVEEILAELDPPYAVLNVGASTSDPQEPRLSVQTYEMTLVVAVEGDKLGQFALVGGGRQQGQEGSDGRGLLEVQEPVLEACSRLTGADGMNVICAGESAVLAGWVQNLGHVNQRGFRLQAVKSQRRYYHPPQNLRKVGDDVVWTLPPDRWDRLRVILVRKSGAAPPTDVNDGTRMTLSGDLAESFTDTSTGVAYSIFAAYDETYGDVEDIERKPTNEERYSDAAPDLPGTTLVVP